MDYCHGVNVTYKTSFIKRSVSENLYLNKLVCHSQRMLSGLFSKKQLINILCFITSRGHCCTTTEEDGLMRRRGV